MTIRPVPFTPKSREEARRSLIRRDTLWRNRDFLSLWAGQTVSLVGSQITPIALPLLAVLNLQATPGQMALLRALSFRACQSSTSRFAAAAPGADVGA